MIANNPKDDRGWESRATSPWDLWETLPELLSGERTASFCAIHGAAGDLICATRNSFSGEMSSDGCSLWHIAMWGGAWF